MTPLRARPATEDVATAANAPSGDGLDSANERRITWLWCAIFLALLWLSRGWASLWVDETGMVWAIAGGLGDIYHRAIVLPQSILYCVVMWAVTGVAGVGEMTLRLPSLLAITGAVWLLYRLGRDLFDRGTGLLAAAMFMAMWPVAFAAADARPYALALLMVIWSTVRLHAWMERPTLGNAVLYAVTFTLVVHFCYFFGLLGAAHVLYGALQWRQRPVLLRQAAAAAALIGLGLLPLVRQFRSLSEQRALHFFDAPASWGSLTEVLLPPRIALAMVLGVSVAYVVRRARPAIILPAATPAALLVIAWAIVPTAAMFALATAGRVPFAHRYLLGAAPGVALLCGVLVRSLSPPFARMSVLTVLGLVTLVSTARSGLLSSGEEWREAMASVRALRAGTDLPVLVVSRFTESKSMAMPPRPEDVNWLVAPLTLYPPGGPVGIVPLKVTEGHWAYMESLISGLERDAPRFAFVVPRDELVGAWLEARGRRRFSIRRVGGSNNPQVLLYEARPAPGALAQGASSAMRREEWERTVQ